MDVTLIPLPQNVYLAFSLTSFKAWFEARKNLDIKYI
jgi:hypothetical protein